MSSVIHVTPAKLEATAAAFEGTNANIKALTSKMTSIVTSLSGNTWSGDAATSYVSKFNGLQDDINKINKMITEHVQDLQQMAKEYERAETTNIDQAKSLKSDVIK